MIQKDLSGSMQMMETEVFSVLFVNLLPREITFCLYVNFTPVERPDYRVGVPKKKQYKLIMDEHGLLEKPKVFKAENRNATTENFPLHIRFQHMELLFLHTKF